MQSIGLKANIPDLRDGGGGHAPERLLSLWEELERYRVPFLVALLLSLMARAQIVISPLYSIDSYAAAYQPSAANYFAFLLSQGRFGLAAIYWLRDSIGYHGFSVGVSSLALAMVAFALAGFFFAKVVLERPSTAEIGLFIVLMTLHPFSTEFFTFSDAALNIMIGLLLSAAGAYLAARGRTRQVAIGLGTLLLVAALSIYQTAIAYALPLCLLALVVRIMDRDSGATNVPFWRWSEVRALAVTVFSVVMYLLIAQLISRISGIPLDGRTDLTGLIDVLAKLKIVWTALGLAVWPISGLIPRSASSLLLAMLGLATSLALAPMLRGGRVVAALLCVGILVFALSFSAGASALGKTVWLVPRVLAPISAFAAGLVVIGWHFGSARWRGILGGASALLTLAYIGASNQILSDQHRLNRWDAQQANRIVDRVERLPRFADIRTVAIIGGEWRRSAALSTTLGDMNVSAFAVQWAKIGLIQEATGYRFAAPTAAENGLATQRCREVPAWPAEASVTVIDSIAVICLSTPN